MNEETVCLSEMLNVSMINLASAKTGVDEVQKYVPEGEVFETLYAVNVNDYTEERKGLTYLPWSDAMVEVTKRYPGMEYNILWFDGNPYLYREGLGYMVFTVVTIEGKSKLMWLPVLDTNNKVMLKKDYTFDTAAKKGIVVKAATWYDINKAIMRCLVKNFAAFGLGVYIYKKDSLPEPEEEANRAAEEQAKELAEYKKKIKDFGTELITKHKVAKETLWEVVAKENKGDKETANIPDIETCNRVMEALQALKPKKTTKKKEEN